MRIAYINADYGVPVLGGKGASVHVQEMVNAFAALGHDVDLFHCRLGRGNRSPNARLLAIAPGRADDVEATSAPVDKADRHAKERGWIATGRAMELAVIDQHRKTRYDFIYERYSLWSRAGIAAAGRLHIPCVFEVNAPLKREALQYREVAALDVAEKIERDVFTRADRIISVSQDVKDYVVVMGGPADRVTVLANGVDTASFNPQVSPAELPGTAGRRVIGFVGSLKKWHGVRDLLHAFRNLLHNEPDAHLLIVGDGPKRGWIEGFAEGAGITDKVSITGWVAHDELPALIGRMDVAVAPYSGSLDFYFSPLKLFEYMAVGRPIIASDMGQIAKVIEHERSGLLVLPGDVEAMTSSMLRLLRDHDLSRALGSRAAMTARDYTWTANAKRVLEIVASTKTDAVAAVS